MSHMYVTPVARIFNQFLCVNFITERIFCKHVLNLRVSFRDFRKKYQIWKKKNVQFTCARNWNCFRSNFRFFSKRTKTNNVIMIDFVLLIIHELRVCCYNIICLWIIKNVAYMWRWHCTKNEILLKKLLKNSLIGKFIFCVVTCKV